MRTILTLFLSILFILLLNPPISAQGTKRPSVRMEATPARVFLGESLRLQIHLDDFPTRTAPDISYLNGEFGVESLGEQNRNSTKIVVVNGKQQRSEERGITYNYRLTPNREGTIRIASPEFRDGNTIATALPIEVEVIPPTNQEVVILETSSSTNEIYPLTPFDVTLSIYVRQLPGKYADIDDPIRVISKEVGAPQLTIPWLENDKLPRGLTANGNWQDWISAYRTNDGGLIINNIRVESPFDFGFSLFEPRRSQTAFLPRAVQVEITLPNGEKANYLRYSFRRTFIAEKPGHYDFAGASIKGIFAQAPTSKESGNSTNELVPVDIYTLANPLTVIVKDVPVIGRPDDYIGVFGEFNWNATLAPQTVCVGEAMTLILTLQGEGSILNVQQPPLQDNRLITDSFKIYPPTEEIAGTTARFTYAIRPIHAGQLTFPAVEVSYFDVKKEKFVTLSTEPITIEVTKNRAVADDTMNLLVPTKTNRELTRSAEGIFANMTDQRGLVNRKITPAMWSRKVATIFSFGFITWGLIVAFRSGIIVSRRKKNAAISSARRQIESALKTISINPAGSATEIKNAFLTPLGNCSNKPVNTFTEWEIDRILNELIQKNAGDTAILNEIKSLFKKMEEMRYSISPATAEELQTNTMGLFDQWGNYLQKKSNKLLIQKIMKKSSNRTSNLGGTPPGILLLLLLPGLIIGCSRPGLPAVISDYQQALELFEEADQLAGSETIQPGDSKKSGEEQRELFRQSAALYQGLLDRGIESGPILYNQGNAWMRYGDKAKALASWMKAKRYMPADPFLQANIDTIRNEQAGKGRPPAEHLFFWQNLISYPGKWTVSLWLAFLIVMGVIAQALFSGKKTDSQKTKKNGNIVLKTLFRLTGVVTILFGIMTASALYDWYRFDYQKHIIVSLPDQMARKGNSMQYESVFTAELPQWSEGILLEEKGNWLRIRFTDNQADNQTGWLPREAVVIY